MIFKEIVPMVIILTLIISILIASKIKKPDVLSIDGKFAVIGTVLGILITSLNLIYSNNYLITLGPLLTISCLMYLKNRQTFLKEKTYQIFNFDRKTLKITQIIYWICITAALVSYHQATPYYRPPIFFISISVAVAFLGLEILSSNYGQKVNVYKTFLKVFLISLILRYSAYFISSYPIGSDPWAHAEIINDFSLYGTSNLHQIHPYYSNYPLMHIFASITGILGNFAIKESMFVIGTVLVLSTIFVYLIVKNITNNTNLALFSMLLINFSDFHIQWSVQVIAMTFGIALYTIGIYLLIAQKDKHAIIHRLFLILFIFLITWTHTVSSTVLVLSLISLYLGSFIFKTIYRDVNHSVKLTISITICLLFVVTLIYHWMDPNYPFFESITRGLINSLSNEAKFLGRSTISNIDNFWASILDIFGFLTLIFFGILGSLYSLSTKHTSKTKFSLIFMLIVLFFIFFAFPVLGMRNIVPYRWPAFIYTTFVLFAGIGISQFTNSDKNKHYMAVFLLILLSTSSFFMITNSVTNLDSPIYGNDLNQKLVWTESEMTLFEKINNSYDGLIAVDLQTRYRPFQTYLKREETVDYQSTSEGDMNWDYMSSKLVIWRKASLKRPMQVSGPRHPLMLLGKDFKNHLENNFGSIYDTGEARAYMGKSQ